MTNEPPDMPSEGDAPTYFDGKPGPPPSAPSLPSDEKPTFFDDEARHLLDPGTELPPDLAAEHRAVYLRTGDIVANRFQVVKLLGFGGMGAVYHVKDRELHGQDRALKVMLPSLLRSDTARERFLSEVSISQQLGHPGIVRVHDLGLDPERGFRFFTMEYVEGRTLNRLLKERGGKLPVDEALDITRQLCDALEYAHQHTVHRDLKPQNVMVQPDGRIKVLDFGLAKLMSPGRMTRSSMALGTAYYQAPEQSVHLSELDQRADIYSLGVILYQMLTAQIPLGRVKPPSAVVPRLPKALDDVTLKCIEPQPNDRYDTVADLRACLDLVARPKRRALMAAILAVLILAAAGLATYRFVLTQPPQPTASSAVDSAGPSVTSPDTGARDDAGTTPKSPVPPGEGEVPSEPKGEGEAPSEPQREGEAPSEPPRPMATASEASAAKITAQKAEKAALSAGAETHAAELLADAQKLLKEAEAHDTLQAFADAAAKYGEAEAAFVKAEEQAAAIAAEIAAVDQAQSAIDQTKQEADAAGTDYAEAERQLKVAKASYNEAVRVTPGRIEAAQQRQAGDTAKVDLGGGVKLEMVWIPGGTFQMGSPSSEDKREDGEGPVHTVELDGFWLGKYEVTQAQWETVMGSTPSNFKGAHLPVENVSWNDCQEFIRKLNANGQGRFSLPTEAQWEYACRAGTTTPFHFGETISTDQVNYNGNYTYGNGRKGVYRQETTTVGSFPANRWGLHDMHGNVWEWCADWYDGHYYGKSPSRNPTGPTSGPFRVYRGGCWLYYPRICRSAHRDRKEPGFRPFLGFRLAASPAVR